MYPATSTTSGTVSMGLWAMSHSTQLYSTLLYSRISRQPVTIDSKVEKIAGRVTDLDDEHGQTRELVRCPSRRWSYWVVPHSSTPHVPCCRGLLSSLAQPALLNAAIPRVGTEHSGLVLVAHLRQRQRAPFIYPPKYPADCLQHSDK
jgi:hypothetical protein